jgi:transketolase
VRATCLNTILKLAEADPRVFFIGSDLGQNTMTAFAAAFPERFFMEGISEQHILGMAAGLAMEGKIPFVNTIASFLTRRCFEQTVLDLCLQNLPVRLVGNGGGLVYGPLGPTHQTVEDLACFRALPHMTILAPADAVQMRRLMPLTLDWPGPVYIRLGKGHDPIVTAEDTPLAIGRAVPLREGRDALIATTGICLGACLEAADLLAAQGLSAAVLHFPTVKPLDVEGLLAAVSPVRAVVTVEEHSVLGGLGGAVIEVLAEAGALSGRRIRRLGLPDVFADRYGSQAELLAHYGLTAKGVADAVAALAA